MKATYVTKCRKCGKEIGIIEYRAFTKRLVDILPVQVAPDPDGEDFVRIDGSKIRGRMVPYDSGEPNEPAYRLHRYTCGGDP